jgi:DNA polymerase-3 subunit delta
MLAFKSLTALVVLCPTSLTNAIMLIKYQGLSSHLKQSLKPVYVLLGKEPYLLDDAATQLKTAWQTRNESDFLRMDLINSADWSRLLEESRSFSLLAPQIFIDARFDKKTLDKAAKEILDQCIQNPKPHCLILLRASETSAKQWQWLLSHEKVVIVQIDALREAPFRALIANKLKESGIQHSAQVPELIYRYTQNNYLAAAQVIEKLILCHDNSKSLSLEAVHEHLVQQSEFQIYELQDACLAGKFERAMDILQYARQSGVEPSLVLWLMAQETRLLIQIMHLMQTQSFKLGDACQKLKIWQQRSALYAAALQRLNLTALYALLQRCKRLDELIKSSQNHSIWDSFEQLVLGFR